MDRRYYQRTLIEVEGCFIITNEASNDREFTGIIKDISEGGIKVFVDKDKCDSPVQKALRGTVLSFQFYDEYGLFQEIRQEVITGYAEVLRVENSEAGITLGCKLVGINKNLEDYITNKKLSIFFMNMHR